LAPRRGAGRTRSEAQPDSTNSGEFQQFQHIKSNVTGILNVNPAFAGNNAARPGLPKPNAAGANTQTNLPFPFRLANTTKPIEELTRSDNAILLAQCADRRHRRAAVDSGQLRSKGDPGVTSSRRGEKSRTVSASNYGRPTRRSFSYVPNNAYLVQVSEAGANKLQALPEAPTVLPWEPYYKLSPMLLPRRLSRRTCPTAVR